MTTTSIKPLSAAILLALPVAGHASTELIDNGGVETRIAPRACDISGDANCDQSSSLAQTGT
jgi:hypothetical protein